MGPIRRWVARKAIGLPRPFWYLCTAVFVNRLGCFVMPYLATYLTAVRGLSPSVVGWVIGGYGLGGGVGVVIGGVLADRWGRRPTAVAAHVGSATIMFCMGLATDVPTIAACSVLMGVFTEGVRPAYGAALVDLVPPEDRPRASSIYYWVINLGFSVAVLLGGFLAKASYLMLFLADSATTLAAAGVLMLGLRGLRATQDTATQGPGRSQGRDGLALVLSDRLFLAYLACTLAGGLTFMQHLSALPIAMVRDGLSPASYGSVLAVNGIMIVFGQFAVIRMVAGVLPGRVLSMALVVVGVGFGLTSVADSVPTYAATVAVWTVGEMLQSVSALPIIGALSPDHLRGRYQGMVSFAWSGAAFLAPVLGGALQQWAGDVVLWLAAGASALVAALGHALLASRYQQRAQIGAGVSLARQRAART